MKKTLVALAMLTAYNSSAFAASPVVSVINQTSNFSISQYDAAQTFTGIVTSGYFGTLNANTKVKVTATFLGSEASHTNTFNLGGSILYRNATTPVSNIFNAGTISFSFTDTNLPSATTSNGITFTSANTRNTFAFLNTSVNPGHYDFLIGYNDKGGDSDFDDFVVGIKVSAVPEPETYAMMIAGLGLVGFASSRRRIKS